VKIQTLAPIRYPRFSFASNKNGLIDFAHAIDSGGNEMLPQSQHPLRDAVGEDVRFKRFRTTQKDCQNCVNYFLDEEYTDEDLGTGTVDDWWWVSECSKGLFPRGCPLAPTASKCESFVRIE